MNSQEEMDPFHKDILKRLRKNIVDDVDVFNGIIHPLASEYILKDSDIISIENGETKEERVDRLLDILPSRGSMAFDIFHQALRHHYSWLGERMDKLLESNGSVANDMGHYIGSPNIPPISPLTVTREDKTKQLKNALKKLEPGGYIAIHGMKGFGKSSLTASTLKDSKLIKDLFGNKIHWIKFGYERSIDEEILIQLNGLCHLVKNVVEIVLPNPSKSEFLKESLIQFLKNHFNKKDNRNALLILDDVCNEKIIEVFDFDCKTLVITADIGVLYGKSRTVIEMNDGFTETETLGLFAKVLDVEINHLPLEAKRIHEECKGMPLLIAMFAAQFEEFKNDMRISDRRWKYYLECLRKKDPSNDVIRRFLGIQEAIFDMCINELSPKLKKLYEELVIFSEDVNITPLTLEILWGGRAFEIEEKMLTLCHKSLAAKQWNADLKSYVYGVHDLLLCHLRNKNKNLIETHKSFVEKYRKYCNNDFSKLPEDNYSYSYIGHHLEQAQMYDEFANLYLNFDFIENKILYTGLSDLLIDLKKYRKHITNNNDPSYESKVKDLEKFIEERASILSEHRRKKCLDITQIALNYGHPGFINEQGERLASKRGHYLYLSHKEKSMYPNISPMSEEVSTDISVSAFTDDYDKILIGNDYGEIVLWNCTHKNIVFSTWHDGKYGIKKLVLSPDGQLFLSLSKNGSVKLFQLRHDEDKPAIHSPKQKQIWWSNLFDNEKRRDDSILNLKIDYEIILDVIFGHDGKHVAACTNKGTIRVWDLTGQLISHITSPKNSCLKSIAFTSQDVLLHAMDEANGILITYGKCGNNYNYMSQFNPGLKGKKIVYFHNIPRNDNSLIIVTENKANYVKWFRSQNDLIHSYKTQVRANIENDNVRYLCAALTYDGQYLILADTDGFINLWKVDLVEYQPIATFKSRVYSLDTYWLEDDGYHIICGSENRLLHRWKIPGGEGEKSFRTVVFDALLKSHDEKNVIAKESLKNTIIIMNDDDVIAETEPANGKILTLSLSSCGKKVIYSTENGIISLFEVDNKKTYQVMKLNRPTEFIRFLKIEDNDIIVCRESDDQLKVWHNIKVAYLVDTLGRVISIHTINKKRVITVTENGYVTIWEIDGTHWYCLNKIHYANTIFHSNLSHFKTYCIVLTRNRELVTYKLWENEHLTPIQLDLQMNFKLGFTENLTTCEVSQNEQYLAVGLKNGDISVIDLKKQHEIHKLSFHNSAINQLSWAPIGVGTPILLSVNNDDIVWWNIDLIDHNKQQSKRKSRMGRMCNSVSTPSFGTYEKYHNFSMTSSSSVNDHMINGGSMNQDYWKCKIAKYPNQSNLLALVKLPPTCTPKVYTSFDFSKFLTIDINGSINTFKLFQYP